MKGNKGVKEMARRDIRDYFIPCPYLVTANMLDTKEITRFNRQLGLDTINHGKRNK